jgi:hypothetical protein
MRVSQAAVVLSLLTAALALAAASSGLLWPDSGGPSTFTTVRGETVTLSGRGLYRYDTVLQGAGNTGTDLFIIVIGVPLLIGAALRYRRGSLKGGLLLAGTLAYFLYTYLSAAFGYAYNNLYLLYVAIFSASFFGLALTLLSFDVATLPSHFSERAPRRGIASFLFVVAAALVIVWVGLSILPALLRGTPPPELQSSSTLVTHGLDVGIIAPAAALTGVLLLHREPVADLLAGMMLVLSWVLGLSVLALSAAQVLAGLLSVPQFVGFVLPFLVLTLASLGLTAALFLQGVDTTPARRTGE